MFIDGTEYQTGPGRCSQQAKPGQIGVLHEVRTTDVSEPSQVVVVCDVCAAVDACWSSMLTHISACGGYRLTSGALLLEAVSLSLKIWLVLLTGLSRKQARVIGKYHICPAFTTRGS